jgi:hypothetical protein
VAKAVFWWVALRLQVGSERKSTHFFIVQGLCTKSRPCLARLVPFKKRVALITRSVDSVIELFVQS